MTDQTIITIDWTHKTVSVETPPQPTVDELRARQQKLYEMAEKADATPGTDPDLIKAIWDYVEEIDKRIEARK